MKHEKKIITEVTNLWVSQNLIAIFARSKLKLFAKFQYSSMTFAAFAVWYLGKYLLNKAILELQEQHIHQLQKDLQCRLIKKFLLVYN